MSGADLHERIAAFLTGYRLADGDPSAMQRVALQAFPRAERADFTAGLDLANAATRRPVEPCKP